MSGQGITQYIDVAQIALYAFWIFFAGLIWYLRREDKREGYPLESERSSRVTVQGYPTIPSPKIFHKPHGGTVSVPTRRGDERPVKARPIAAWPGAPLEPTGDPMADGVGPAAWAERADVPDLTIDGDARIVPLRAVKAVKLAHSDPDPRGMPVVGADGAVAGVVVDAWIDRSEAILRYLEVEVGGAPKASGASGAASAKRVLLPINFTKFERHGIKVRALLARQFAGVPSTKQPDTVTLLEEDKIMGYYGGGKLYAEPSRLGPWF